MTAITAPTPQKRPLSSLMTAKTNFVASINHGIEALMQGSGHSRERATKTLLRELGRGGQAPTENEIFHMMELQGLGMDEAAKALVVSKAVRRAMKDQGFSAVEAIDDLISKMSLANLLASASPPKPQEEPTTVKSNPLRRVLSSTTLLQQPMPIAPMSQRKPSARKIMQKSKSKNVRKRSISEEQEIKIEKTTRARVDSVTEQVNAKLATQPKAERPPVLPKGKRNLDGNTAHAAVQPPTKRPREA